MLNLLPSFLPFAFHQLYTKFAFIYDTFSNVVSRGEWWTWTRAAIPFIRGTRVLKLAFGSGNLHLDLHDAGYVSIGTDLSPYMLDITRSKFAARFRGTSILPRLAHADAKRLPFSPDYFSSLVITFPPGFVFDAVAMREL